MMLRTGVLKKKIILSRCIMYGGIKYDVRSKVTHLLSGDRVLLHIFLGAFATEVAADFAKGGFQPQSVIRA